MRWIYALCLPVFLAASPALAQDDLREGLSLLERGMRQFLRGLGDEIEPTLRDLSDHLAPMMRDLQGMIDDLDRYHAPEKLPNGDIILRRKSEPGGIEI